MSRFKHTRLALGSLTALIVLVAAIVIAANNTDATALSPVQCPGGSVDGRCTTIFHYEGRNLSLDEFNEARRSGKGLYIVPSGSDAWVFDSETEMDAYAKKHGLSWDPPSPATK